MAQRGADFSSGEESSRDKGWSCDDGSYHYKFEQELRPGLTKKQDHWNTVKQYFSEKEEARCKVWREEVNNILIFSGLFSAVVTALIVESYGDLKDDPNQVLLSNIAKGVARMANITEAPIISDPPPSLASLFINSLWFLSLIFSLATAVISIVALQWLREHLRVPTEDVKPSFLPALLQMQSESLDRFLVPQIFNALPLLLLTGLILFLIGLITFLWSLSKPVAIPSSLAIALIFGFLFFTTLYPGLQSLPKDHDHSPTPDPPIILSPISRSDDTSGSPDLSEQQSQSENADSSPESIPDAASSHGQTHVLPWSPCPYKSPQSHAFLRFRIAIQSLIQRAHSHFGGSKGARNFINLERFGLEENWSHFTIMCLLQRDANERQKLPYDPTEISDQSDLTPLYDCVKALLKAKQGFLKSANHKVLDVYRCFGDIVEEAKKGRTKTQRHLYNLVPVDSSKMGDLCMKLQNFDLKTRAVALKPTMDSIQLFFGLYDDESADPARNPLPSHLHVEACVRVSDWMVQNLTRPCVTPPAFPAILFTGEVIRGTSEPFRTTITHQLLLLLDKFVDAAACFWPQLEKAMKPEGDARGFCEILAHAFNEHPALKEHWPEHVMPDNPSRDNLLLGFGSVAKKHQLRGDPDGFLYFLASLLDQQGATERSHSMKNLPGLFGISPHIKGFLQIVSAAVLAARNLNIADLHNKILRKIRRHFLGSEDHNLEYLYVISRLYVEQFKARQDISEGASNDDIQDLERTLKGLQGKEEKNLRTIAIFILLDVNTKVRLDRRRPQAILPPDPWLGFLNILGLPGPVTSEPDHIQDDNDDQEPNSSSLTASDQ